MGAYLTGNQSAMGIDADMIVLKYFEKVSLYKFTSDPVNCRLKTLSLYNFLRGFK